MPARQDTTHVYFASVSKERCIGRNWSQTLEILASRVRPKVCVARWPISMPTHTTHTFHHLRFKSLMENNFIVFALGQTQKHRATIPKMRRTIQQ